jgi:hypothetical protein
MEARVTNSNRRCGRRGGVGRVEVGQKLISSMSTPLLCFCDGSWQIYERVKIRALQYDNN